MFNPDQSLADLALAHPAASRVFRQYKLDFCCGGHRSVREACAARGIDATVVLGALEEDARAVGPDVRALSLAELTAYIVTRFHEAHRAEFPDLIELARKVERVHAGKPGVPAGLAHHLSEMACDLEEHMLKEEAVVFPAIVRGARGNLAMAIGVLTQEHAEHGEALARLRALANDFVPPAHACTSWRALYLRCAELEAELMRHVHLENYVLFPRVSKGER